MRLRVDLLRYAPDVASRFGLVEAEADVLEREAETLLPEVAE